MDSDVAYVEEAEGFLLICANLTGQSEIDIPVIFTTSELSATSTATVSHMNNIITSFFSPNSRRGRFR